MTGWPAPWMWDLFLGVIVVARYGLPSVLVFAGLWRRNFWLIYCGFFLAAVFVVTGGLS